MLPDFFLQLVDNHGDSLQQMALLAYLKNEKHGKPLLEAVATAQVKIFCVLLLVFEYFII